MPILPTGQERLKPLTDPGLQPAEKIAPPRPCHPRLGQQDPQLEQRQMIAFSRHRHS